MDLKISGLKVDQGGEGSRGGVIIGRTGSGKPIYQNARHPSHSDFSDPDHKDAIALRRKLQQESRRNNPHDDVETHKHQLAIRVHAKATRPSRPGTR